jgi:hypothetical protein
MLNQGEIEREIKVGKIFYSREEIELSILIIETRCVVLVKGVVWLILTVTFICTDYEQV